MTHSFYAKALSKKMILNQGKSTPGIDGIIKCLLQNQDALVYLSHKKRSLLSYKKIWVSGSSLNAKRYYFNKCPKIGQSTEHNSLENSLG
ncbi:hypothetical protein [Enterococcus sp. AZ072]|uniref:hypothetical protein n=1 Tax=unclassified Enterococcus TaxID=2608891 RepID=UPI003D26D093